MIVERLKKLFAAFALKDRSPRTLALSCAFGVYIAFSPFIFLHTVMVILFSWLFSLNVAVTFALSTLINNPWTMALVYGLDYVVGCWLFGTCGIDGMALNPSWMIRLNEILAKYTGLTGISFWSFMVGGNLLGIVCAFAAYPFLRPLFEKLLRRNKEPQINDPVVTE